jgi:hypothetical protein
VAAGGGGGDWRAFYFLCYFCPVCSYKTSAIVSVERDDFLKGATFLAHGSVQVYGE